MFSINKVEFNVTIAPKWVLLFVHTVICVSGHIRMNSCFCLCCWPELSLEKCWRGKLVSWLSAFQQHLLQRLELASVCLQRTPETCWTRYWQTHREDFLYLNQTYKQVLRCFLLYLGAAASKRGGRQTLSEVLAAETLRSASPLRWHRLWAGQLKWPVTPSLCNVKTKS